MEDNVEHNSVEDKRSRFWNAEPTNNVIHYFNINPRTDCSPKRWISV
jgi:hypothetical protein